jgi:hypothetical protein
MGRSMFHICSHDKRGRDRTLSTMTGGVSCAVRADISASSGMSGRQRFAMAAAMKLTILPCPVHTLQNGPSPGVRDGLGIVGDVGAGDHLDGFSEARTIRVAPVTVGHEPGSAA